MELVEVEQIVREFEHDREIMLELVDHVGAALVWLLDYTKKQKIPLDDAMGFHIQRIRSLLSEISNPPSSKILHGTTQFDDKRPPDKLPVYPWRGAI